MRTHYKNGDDIAESFRFHGCETCSPSTVNGRIVHEHGCDSRWKDVPVPCWGCGFDHYSVSRFSYCADCADQGGDE
jgi:hypothetical protein